MKFTDEEVETIEAALAAATSARAEELRAKIKRRRAGSGLAHYHFFTGTWLARDWAKVNRLKVEDYAGWEAYIARDTTIYQHAACGALHQPDGTTWCGQPTKVTFTKELTAVTCKKCRKWLHLDPDTPVLTPPVKRTRNITLEL